LCVGLQREQGSASLPYRPQSCTEPRRLREEGLKRNTKKRRRRTRASGKRKGVGAFALWGWERRAEKSRERAHTIGGRRQKPLGQDAFLLLLQKIGFG
jgi:hypothetical protein